MGSQTTVQISNTSNTCRRLAELGFRPINGLSHYWIYDDLYQSGCGVVACVHHRKVVLTTFDHANEHDMRIANQAMQALGGKLAHHTQL